MTTSCTLCDATDANTYTVLLNEFARAVVPPSPIIPGHIIICPIRSLTSFTELLREELESFFRLAAVVTPALQRTYKAQGFHYTWSEGALLGKSAHRLHLHILPWREGETSIDGYDPSVLIKKETGSEKLPVEELRSITEKIRENVIG